MSKNDIYKTKRTKELNEYVGVENEKYLSKLIDEIVLMEIKMDELKKIPFLTFNPNNPQEQKKTDAAKLYLSILAQYTQDIKSLSFLASKVKSDEQDDSLLKNWLVNNKNLQE